MEQVNNTEKAPSREIDIVAMVRRVFTEKKLLAIYFLVSAVIGVVVALATPKEYTADVVIAPESSEAGGLGDIGGIASSFGINLGGIGSDDAIYPDIYPDVLASTDFILALFTVPVRTKDSEELITYRQHLVDDTTIPFWTYPRLWLRKLIQKRDTISGAGPYDAMILSMKDTKLCEQVRSAIGCKVSKKTSTIYISIVDEDPMVAAILADTLQARLQAYIINYRTKKAQNDYAYYSKMCDDAEAQYKAAQHAYSSYADSHFDVMLQAYQQHMDALENDMQLRFNVYNQMMLQKQMAQAKIQERTPAFTILERSYVPVEASSTPRALIVICITFLGCCLDALWVLWGRALVKKI